MIYFYLKILHILSASCVLTSMMYSFHLWRSIDGHNLVTIAQRIQKQTALIIMPFALFQLATGFTMMSLKRYPWESFWISGSLTSFITAIVSWFGFIYFLLLSQQATIQPNPSTPRTHYRRLQSCMLLLSALGLLSMVFFMANKTGSS